MLQSRALGALFFWRDDGGHSAAVIAPVDDELWSVMGFRHGQIMPGAAAAFDAYGRGSLVGFLGHGFAGHIQAAIIS